MDKQINELLEVLKEYQELGISEQIDYQKFYLYSIITHSTAIEGSTVTEIENQLLFDEGITAKGKPMVEQLMNLDLKRAYEQSIRWAREHKPFTVEMLKNLSALVMRNTGSHYSTLMGEFDSSKGDLRLVGVTAGAGGRSYMDYRKVPMKLEELCNHINQRREALIKSPNAIDAYLLSFDAHNILVTIHPWVDGNGRMSRLIMNHLQFEFGLVPAKIIKEDKAQYIEALNESREEEAMAPFQEFMLKEHTQIYLVYAYSYVAHGIRTVSIDFQASTVVCKQIYVRLQRVIIKQCEIIVLVHLELAVCYYGILGIHVESCAAVGQQGTHSDIHSFNTFFVFIDNFHTGPVVQQISVYSGGEDIRIVFGGIVNKTFETQSCGILIKRNIHRIEQNGASIQTVNIPRAVYSVMRVAL